MKYADKLRDPRWQKLRLQIMERDEWTCQCCGDNDTTLNIHHRQYCGNPWEADPDMLETLCEPCHKDRTDINKRFLSMDSLGAQVVMGIFDDFRTGKLEYVTSKKKDK